MALGVTDPGFVSWEEEEEYRKRHPVQEGEQILFGEEEEEDRIPLEGEKGTPSYVPGTAPSTVPGLMPLPVPAQPGTIDVSKLPQGVKLKEVPGQPQEQPQDQQPTYTSEGLPQGVKLKEPLPEGYGLPKTPEPVPVSYQGDLYPRAAAQRAHLIAEIESNPRLKEYLAVVVSQEAGKPDGILGVTESLFNRTLQRRSTIARQLTNGFYGPVNRGVVDNLLARNGGKPEQWMVDQLDTALDAVRNGSNFIQGRTDQGMINEIKGPATKYGDEYFGYMDGDPTWSLRWNRDIGEPGGVTSMRGKTPAGKVPGLLPLPEARKPGEIDVSKLPPGVKIVSVPGQGEKVEPPKTPEVTFRQLPSGEYAPTSLEGQEGAIPAPGKAEIPAITKGMLYKPPEELPRLSPTVAREMGLQRWIDQDTGREVRRAELAYPPHLPTKEEGYNTHLNPVEEKAFQKWKKVYAPLDSGEDYDLRGAYKSGLKPGPDFHWPDTFKKPNHPTFSIESQYAVGKDAAKAGMWEGDQFIPPQERRARNRQKLIDTIAGLEKEGYVVPHTIGKPDEPEGDRAPTADMETVSDTLKRKAAREARTGRYDLSKETLKEKAYWDNIIKTQGMSAEQAAAAGEKPSKQEMISILSGKAERKANTNDIVDAVNSLMRGASSDGGLLSTLQGADDIVYQHTKDIPALKFIADNAKRNRDQLAEMRERVRKRLPVDKDFQESLGGGIFTGLGQLANAPIYIGAAAVAGPVGSGSAIVAMSLGQLWQEKKDDLIETAKRTGKPISDDEANKAAWQYVLVAAPVDALADRFVLGKFLKAAKARNLTVGQVIKEGGKGFLAEGSTESMQEGWGNAVDILNKLDPEQKFDDNMLESFIVGGTVGFAGRGGGAAFGPKAAAPTTPLVPPGTLTGAAAQMGGGTAPFTPPGAPPSAPPSGGQAAPVTPTAPAPAPAAAPIEPTSEEHTTKSNIVRDSSGKKGDVIKEEEGVLTVDWEDGKQSQVNESDVERRDKTRTVQKNTVSIEPSGKKKWKVVHYDDSGKRTTTAAAATPEIATQAAKDITEKNNYSGYYDQDGNFVRERGAPAEAPVTVTPAPAPVPAPAAVAPAPAVEEGTEELPGMTPEQKKILLGGKQPVVKGWFQQILSSLGLRKGLTKAQIRDQLHRIDPTEINTAFLSFKIGNETIQDKLNRKLGALGIPYRFTDTTDTTSIGGITARDARQESTIFDINQYAWLEDLLAAPESERENVFNDFFNEERIHAAQVHVVKDEYASLPNRDEYEARANLAGDPGNGFFYYWRERVNGIFDNLRVTADSLPAKERKAVQQMMVDFVDSYYGDMFSDDPNARYGGSLEDIFDFITGSSRQVDPRQLTRVMEILRIAQQYKRSGKISESTLAKIYNNIAQWFRDVIGRVNTALANIYGGKQTPAGKVVAEALKEFIDKVDKVLDDAEAKEASRTYSIVNPLPEGSKELEDFRGQTTVTIDPNTGQHQPVFHASANKSYQTQGLGTHVGFTSNVFRDVFRDTRGNVEAAIGHIGMPLHMKLENPVQLDVSRWQRPDFSPVNVAWSLEVDGYFTRANIAAIQSTHGGQITHAGIKAALQKKGYDGIDYQGGFIVFNADQLISAAVDTGLGINSLKGREKNESSFEHKVVEAHNKNGGSSTNVRTGAVSPKEDVYMVGVYPDAGYIVKGRMLVEQDIIDYETKLREKGVELNTDSLVMGTWYNEKADQTELDVSAKVPDFRAALWVASDYKQVAIWDNALQETIYLQGAQPSVGGLPALSERLGFLAGRLKEGPVLSDPYSFNIENLDISTLPKPISDKEIEASVIRGKDWKTWYTTLDNFMRSLTAKDPNYRPLWAWFFAATSPHALVGANVTSSMKAFRNFVEFGDPAIKGFMGGYRPNLRRVAELPSGAKFEPRPRVGEVIGGGVGLTGGKVPEFAPASLGDPYAIAIDMHVASVLFGTDNPSEWQRFAGQMAVQRIAKRMGWSWAETQAALFADHIIQTGGTLKRAEDYMEKYANEFLNLVEADKHRGAPGAGIGGRILERAGARIGPERFLKDQNGNIQSIRDARYVAINGIVAERISLTGPRGISLEGRGKTDTGVPTTAFERRIPKAWKFLPFLYNGAKQVMWNSPGLTGMGNLIHMHQDLKAKYTGMVTGPFHKWAGSFTAGPLLRPAAKKAINEHTAYRQAKAAGRPLPALSKAGKELKDVYDKVIHIINSKNSSMHIKIKHPDTGKYVQIPHMEYPAKIKEKFMKAMRDPHANQPAYRELRDALIADKILPPNATDADVRAHISKILNTYDSNGAFSRFFFFPKTMPASAYDYGYPAMHEFLQAWTERMAQTEAYGQNPYNDAWEVAINSTHDTRTKNYLRNVKALAYGNTVTDATGRFIVSAGNMASLWHLASWPGAMRNLVYGMGFNAQALGKHFIPGLWQQIAHPFQTELDAIERGILVRDMMNVMSDGERIGAGARVTSKILGAGFKVSLWSTVENWNRGVAMRGSESLLRQAIKNYLKNPRSGKTLRYMSYFNRLGIDGEALLKEGGRGDVTDSYLRAAVNEIQAGYSFADVPVYMETPVGKALFKYRKWGAEQTKHFVREVLEPTGRALRIMPEEVVEVTNPKTGARELVKVPRSLSEMIPAARYLILVAMAAYGAEWGLEQLFGIHPKTIRLARIMQEWKTNKREAFIDFMSNMYQWHLQAGSMGLLGSYIQTGLVWSGLVQPRGPKESITDIAENIPTIDPFLKVADAIKIAQEKGWQNVGWRDLDNLANSFAGYRAGRQIEARARDVIGIPTRYSTIVANRQDLAMVKNLQKEFTLDQEKKLKKPMGERPEKTERSVWREPLDEALSIGDIDWARQILRDVRSGMSQARWEIEEKALKAHVRAKQPIQVLGGGEVPRQDFVKWVNEKASPYEYETVRRVHATYRRTARQLELGFDQPPPSIEEVIKFYEQQRIKAEPTTYKPGPAPAFTPAAR